MNRFRNDAEDFGEDAAVALNARLTLREHILWTDFSALGLGADRPRPGERSHGDDARGPHLLPPDHFASALTAPDGETSMIGTITTPGLSGNAAVDALLAGTAWSMATINYSFPTAASDYEVGYGDGEPNNNFEVATLEFQQAIRYILEGSSSVVGGHAFTYLATEGFLLVDFAETIPLLGHIQVASSADPGTAWGYYPWTDEEGGDVWFNNTYAGSRTIPYPQIGDYNWHTAIHELGHALGLKHGHETDGLTGNPVPAFMDSLEYTVMTYRSYVGASTSGGYTNESWGFPQTWMMLDIAALQQMYGADFTYNNTNTTYTWNPNTGEMSVNGVGQGTPGANRVFLTIWDGGGVDTYDFSNYTTGPVTVDLAPGGYSITSEGQLANLGNNHFARGNVFNSLLYQNNTASLIENAIGTIWGDQISGNQAANRLEGRGNFDNLNGLAGDDVIVGGADNDFLNGGSGADVFIFSAGDAQDTIGDFKVGGDADKIRVIGYSSYTLSQEGVNTRVTFSASDSIVLMNTTMASVLASDFLWGPEVNRIDGSAAGETLTGTANADEIYGLAGADTLKGEGGNDFLYGGDDNDILEGGLGDDLIDGGAGTNDRADYRNAASAVTVSLALTTAQNTQGAGTDTLTGIEQLLGSAFNDIFSGGDAGETLDGKAGNDTLTGNNGGDILIGGAGADLLNGGGGLDYASYITATSGVTVNLTTNLHAGDAAGDTFNLIERYRLSAHADTFTGAAATDYAYGAEGSDTLNGAGGIDRLYGQADNDTLNGDAGNDILLGGAGADVHNGGADRDTASYEESTIGLTINLTTGVHTGDATGDTFNSIEILWLSTHNDIFTGSAGDDEVRGNNGVDTLSGAAGSDVLRGEAGNDILNGDDNDDFLNGGLGADALNGGNGTDTAVYLLAEAGVTINLTTGVHGGEAAGDTYTSVERFQLSNGFTLADSFTGLAGNDWVAGYKGVDTLNGMDGDDTLNGGEHNDVLNGGNGLDKLIAGTGNDTLTGGADADQFHFNVALFGADTITDWQDGVDKIRITGQPGIDNINDLTITQAGAHVEITLPDGSKIVVNNTLVAAIDASDFLWI